MSLQKKAISGFIWTGLEQFGAQAISLAVSIILARILLPSDFGLIGMIIIFIALGKSLMDAGLSQSLIRSQNPDHLDYSTVFFFNLCASAVIYLFVFIAAPQIAQFYEQPILTNILRWYGIVFIFNALGNIQQTRIIKRLEFRSLFKISIPAIITGGIVGIIMAFKGYGVWSLVVSAIVQATIQAALLWFFGKWKPTMVFSKLKFKEHFSYGYKLTLSGLIDVVYNNSYAVLIGKFFSINELGYFTRANTLKQVPVQNVGTVLNKVTFPLFAEIQNDNIKLKGAYQKIMQIVLFAIAPLLLISAALAEPLFRFLLTEKWLPAVPYYQILCWAGILYPINAYNLNVLKVKGRSDLFLKLELIKKGIGAIIIFGTFAYGVTALLIGSVFISIIAFFVNSYYTAKFIKYSAFEQLKDIVPTILISAISALAIWKIDQLVKDVLVYDLIRLLVLGLLGIILYVILIRLFQPKVYKGAIEIVKNK